MRARAERLREAARLQLGLLPFGLKRLLNLAAIAVILCGLGVTALLVILTASRDGCSDSGLACGVAGGFVTSFGLFLFGFVLIAVVAAQVLARYLRGVVEDQRGAPASDAQVGAIVRDVTAAGSARDGAPRILVGQSGAGRSTLLTQLARDLVAASWVPVLVSLRAGMPFPGFLELARSAFLDAIDMEIASADEGERIWRRVCGSGRLVLLVDDLQRVDVSDALRMRAAFEQAREQGYALIATSRPHGVPRSLSRWVTDVGRLSPEEAMRAILDAAGPAGAVPSARRDHVASLVERGGFGDSPYYVTVLVVLARAGALDRVDAIRADGDVDELRRSVLDVFVAAYADGTLAPDDHSTTAERGRALSVIELAAFDALLLGERASLDPTIPGVSAALEAGLLGAEQDDAARVRHALLQDYLASRAIGDGPSWRMLLASRTQDVDVLATLRFWAACEEHPDRAVAAYEALLDRSWKLKDPRALRFVMTAARISRAAGLARREEPWRRSDRRLAVAFADAWEWGDLLDRRAAVELVASLSDRDRFTTLSLCVEDPDYAVRWAAAQSLCGRGSPGGRPDGADLDVPTLRALTGPAFDAAEDVADAVCDGRERPEAIDDWDERIRPLVGLGWVLPLLGTCVRDDALRVEVWEQFARMRYLFDGRGRGLAGAGANARPASFAGVTAQRGPEATIAQGLKSAAILACSAPSSDAATVCALAEQLCDIYETTEFWYSRVVLLHGLAEISLTLQQLLAVPHDAGRQATLRAIASRTAALIEGATRPGPSAVPGAGGHPFAVATAKVARDGLTRATAQPDPARAREILRRHVWSDEAEAVASPASDLEPVAIRLLGGITVLLNLIERGDQRQRTLLSVRADLPPCLAGGERPDLLLDRVGDAGCGCEFGLCAKRAPLARDAVRPLSKAFCRRAQLAADQRVPGWDTTVKARDVRRYWREMEQRAER